MKYLLYSLPLIMIGVLCFYGYCLAGEAPTAVLSSYEDGFPVNLQAQQHKVIAHFPIPATRIPRPSAEDALYIAQGESGSENLVETFSLSYQALPEQIAKIKAGSERALLERFVTHLQLSGAIKIQPLSLPNDSIKGKSEGVFSLLEVEDKDRTDYYAVRVLRIGNDGVVVAVRTIQKSQRKKQELGSPRLWSFLQSINVQKLVSNK